MSWSKRQSSSPPQAWRRYLREGLGIRRSFLLGVALITGLMVFVVSAALINSERLSSDVNNILGERLPATMNSFRTARAVDDLATTALILFNINNEAEKQQAFSDLDEAQAQLTPYLELLSEYIDTESTQAILNYLKS